MPILIYNSLTRKKEPLRPPDKAKPIKMYSCGVTVYDKCHIGHARSLYIFDVIKRYLTFRGYKVQFVRNITDVDDKIISRAKETGKSFDEVVKENIDAYYKDLESLGIQKADHEPRATQNIGLIKDAIQKLIDKGFAYVADGDVYYSVRKFKDYGKLSGQSIDQMMEGVRIEPAEKKKDPLDFALWKKAKAGEPFWESPWSQGRPGWHIECSCMSMNELKAKTLDIHAGGRDLIFPHHENEIAQSEALTGKKFANMWIHHGLLTINGQKMAKSLGNFITVQDALKKYNPNFLKLFFLSSHYASPIDFSKMKMEEVKKNYESIDILVKRLERVKASGGAGDMTSYIDQFQSCMDDDFNTPKALGVVHEMISECHKALDGNDRDKDVLIKGALVFIKEFFWIFGLTFFDKADGVMSDDTINAQIQLREDLRRQKKFNEADDIRKNLEKNGVILEDTKGGTAWRRKL